MINHPTPFVMKNAMKNMSVGTKLGLSCILILLLVYLVLSVKFLLS
ncbi:hypothetical protein SAMN05444377_11211 [Flavobacterium fontis]|uniref:Uncharacterized protein n=1 Tax=Flavobacterium fontis TaxID=1124188 RepID=A0A1M5CJ44_9FLAO|nr:hypothetical protein SAMN05444377_11211 [Flavobacterium fontis]